MLQDALNQVEQYLKNQYANINCNISNDRIIAKFNHKADSQVFDANFIVRTESDGRLNTLTVVTAVAPPGTFKNVSTSQRLKILELINDQIGRGYLTKGRFFESDGSIEIEHNLPLNNGMPREQDVIRVLCSIIEMADTVYPELMKIKWS